MTPAKSARVPRGVWILGFVSMLMDTSSEMIHAVLPMFLVSGLGLPVVSVGLIEGLADATTQITKAFSGAVSDRLGKRKLLAVLGYGLAAASKPIFPLSTGIVSVLVARLMDRFGKGIRGAPRDALIADIVEDGGHGAAFGLRQALDSVGAVAGPLAAVAVMALTADNFRITMWVAVVPAILCVVLLVKGVEERAVPKVQDGKAHPLRSREWLALGRPFWIFVAVAFALSLPRFSEAFMLLRAQGLGLGEDFVPLIFVAMNIVYALVSFPAGRLSDRVGRRALVAIGFAVLLVADVVLAMADTPALVFLGAVVWGLHMGLTQGVLSAIVADVAPARLRATAFGLYNMAIGFAALFGSLAAGEIWDRVGPAYTFWAGAVVMAMALGAYALVQFGRRRQG